jgi:serine/threonine-protein kinase HipA
MSTIIHLPGETDTALQLYEGDLDDAFYSTYGFYGLPNFRELGKKIGLLPQRIERILTQLLSKNEDVARMIGYSNLSDKTKNAYAIAFEDKVKRMGIT